MRRVLTVLFLLFMLASASAVSQLANNSFESVLSGSDWTDTAMTCTLPGSSTANYLVSDRNQIYSPVGGWGYNLEAHISNVGAGNSFCDLNLSHATSVPADLNMCWSIQSMPVNTQTKTEMIIFLNDVNVFTVWTGLSANDDLDSLYPDGNQVCANTGAGGDMNVNMKLTNINVGATNRIFIRLDNFYLYSDKNMALTNYTPTQVTSGVDFNILIAVQDSTSAVHLSGADVNINFDGDGVEPMTWAPDINRFFVTKNIGSGTFGFDVNASFTDYADANLNADTGASGSTSNPVVSVITPTADFLSFTPIANIDSHRFGSITIDPANNLNTLIWRVDSNSVGSESIEYIIQNALNDGRQYFIYVANQFMYDNNNWAFQDTLTYGSSNTNPIQKIWDNNISEYTHTFTDTLLPLERKYYRLTYRSPAKYWETTGGSSDWLMQYAPSTQDVNTKSTDAFQVNQFSNVRHEMIEHLPNLISESGHNFNYEIQFTAWASSGTPDVRVGVSTGGANPTVTYTNVTLDANAHRYSVSVNGSNYDAKLLIETNEQSATTIYITDWAILERGFFTKRLEIKTPANLDLPAILIGGSSSQYIREGEQFRADTRAYDREGDLNKLVIEAYLDSNAVGNLANVQIFEIDLGVEGVFSFSDLFAPVIDLNGNAVNPATPRNVIIKARLEDDNAHIVSVQSATYKFIQYPYFTSDVFTNLSVSNAKIGQNPEGFITINLSVPTVLEAYDLYFYSEDANITEPDYYNRFYNGVDFDCQTTSCTIPFLIRDYVWEDQNFYTATLMPIVNTEYVDTSNYLLRKDRIVYITYKVFETLKILQTVQRPDRTYRHDEKVPLVLVVRDSDRENLFNELNVEFRLANCTTSGSGGSCTDGSEIFTPNSHLFDPIGRYNLYFINEFFLYDGAVLDDGNFYRVKAIITDQLGQYSADQNALLTDKCDTNSSDLVASAISSVLNFGFGCTVDENVMVTESTNQASEERLVIDTTHTVSAPSYEALFCFNPDVNNVFVDDLSQDLWCVSIYTIGESAIDKLDFYIGNEFSDYSQKDPELRQYFKASVPFEIIAFNDIGLLKKALEANQNTTCTTLGCLVRLSMNELLKTTLYNFANGLVDTTLKDAVFDNVGADTNFSEIFNPTNISGMVFWQIEDIALTNHQDYLYMEGAENVNPNSLIKFLKESNVIFNDREAKVTMYGSDLRKFIEFKQPANLVINEEPITESQLSSDFNSSSARRAKPRSIFIDVASVLFYNNSLNSFEKYTRMRLETIVPQSFISASLETFGDLLESPVETTIDILFENIMLITVILMFLIVFAYLGFIRPNTGG